MGNLPDIFKDFPGLIKKILGLSRTAKKSRTFPGCGNPKYSIVDRHNANNLQTQVISAP